MQKNKKKLVTKNSAPYIFILPAIILFVLFTAYPIINSIFLSFQKVQGANATFVKLDNYFRLLKDPLFKKALRNTAVILIIQVPTMISMALLLANVLNSKLIKFKGFFRVAYFLPAVTSLISYSILFSILLMQDGLINQLLIRLRLVSEPIHWLTNPFWAKVSIMLAMTWRWTGYNMVIFLSGLQNIAEELYEAASVDGAGIVKRFLHITIPQLKPVILFTTILSTIGTLQLFDEPYILTAGGPSNSTLSLGMYLYQQGFKYYDFGYASALAYAIVIIIVILSFIQFRVAGEEK